MIHFLILNLMSIFKQSEREREEKYYLSFFLFKESLVLFYKSTTRPINHLFV
jgi:hypothetical protein